MKPRIGISMNYRRTDSGVERAYLDSSYLDFLTDYEVLPCPIPPTVDSDQLGEYLNVVDGVLFTGGMDLDPGLWDEPIHPKTELVHSRRQRYDLLLYELVCQRRTPIMGVCLGLQMINIAHGGSLYQHLPEKPGSVDHGGEFNFTTHNLNVNIASKFYDWIRTDKIKVAGGHHQGINRLGEGLVAAGTAEDGVVEAVELNDYPFLFAVQWHPEKDMADFVNRTVIEKFIGAVCQTR